ncbi:serine hydrolase domain-containing protein [Colwellia sp. 1_MG-2023]|uniref:serine hydrolase domain-containing protein n=1 Tax=Colwellia sp. 1_MG-2023 TaxID=3062649 RepID=UPI0026E344C7|nr:serine hydrolase domain-containing protein [Colwellia sp. 1_MG-2023]MDO6446624.1 serine hydrolase domain-containing protein [Colwellia sp. 1_MG-2023]
MFSRVYCIFSLIFFSSFLSAKTLEDVNKDFSAYFAQQLINYNIPGAAYVIVKNNKVIALETFGYTDKAKSQPVDKNTIFRLASVSKTFASTITTMLAQEQVLDLSDPITKYVPHFSLATAGAAEKIQLKHLLSHSSGLMPNAYDNLLHENWNMDKIISRFDRIAPICQPERCYGYQNILYGLLQPAIEASQNKNYSTLLDERIFQPLNMKDSSVGIEEFTQQKNTAKPHVLIKATPTGRTDKQGNKLKKYFWRKVNVAPDFYNVAPAAGVNSSISDLAQWLIANLGNSPQVLSPTLIKELTTPRIKTKRDLRRRFWRDYLTDAHYGYGWRIYQLADTEVIYHSGWVEGFRADIGYSPNSGIGFAILFNAESNAINQLSSRFWSQTHQQLSSVGS